MARLKSAFYLSSAGVLFRLDYRDRFLAQARAETEEVDVEAREVEQVLRAAGNDRYSTEQLRILRRVYRTHWLEVLLERSREIRLGHLDRAVERWREAELPRLPTPAQPNDYAQAVSLLGRGWGRGPGAAARKKLRNLLADHYFVAALLGEEAERRNPYLFRERPAPWNGEARERVRQNHRYFLDMQRHQLLAVY